MTENGSGIGKAILEVMSEVGYVQKERKGGLNYSFAGEAALIAALRPSMVKHGIICYVLDLPDVERSGYVTAKGTAMNTTHIHGIVRFEHPESDTYRDVHAIGEGADVGDKAGNKAATGMLKYALRQTFLIETGDDPDATSSEGQERAQPKRQSAKAPSKKRPQKIGEDAVSMFWDLVNQMEFTKDQALQVLEDQGGNFVDAYDALTDSNVPPEDSDD